jgi:sulfite exporter TauE/SafE
MAGEASYLVPLLGGLAGSAHCLGMCGPFALAIAQGGHAPTRTLLYNTGRIGTLLGLGAVSGALGAAVTAQGPAAFAGRILALAAGTHMLAIALEGLGMTRALGERAGTMVRATVGRVLAPVLRAPGMAAPLAFGALNALLPCHLIYAFAAQAAATASPVSGTLVMAAFGLGTLPAMLGAGLLGHRLAPRLRASLSRLAALLVLAFALLTIARGLGVLPGHAEHAEQHGRHHELHHGEHDRRPEDAAPGEGAIPREGRADRDRNGHVAEPDAAEVAVVHVPPDRSVDEHEEQH